MIDHLTIEKIHSAAQIVEVVSDFVTLQKRGVNYVGLCPFHDDRTPSFYVSPAKNICKCFACGEGGAPVNFIMKHEQMTYYDALKYLAKKYNIEVIEKEPTEEEKSAQELRESLFILNEFAANYFTETMLEHPEGRAAGLSYFRERGFHEQTIRKFKLGYALEQRDAFVKEAQKAGYKNEFLLKTGLATGGEQSRPLIDRFRGRVIFPVHTLSGKVVAFGGRILKKTDKAAKYINSPESDIYSKSRELYGLYFSKSAITKSDKCFLVEGYTDVLSMHQAGIENVVSSSGTALTVEQIRLIGRFSNNITLLYDGDAPGIKAALRGIDLLLEAGMNVKIVLLPNGEDPDSFARKQNAEQFHQYIEKNETDFIRFKTNLLLEEAGNDPAKRAGLIYDIVNSIAKIPNNITRNVYIQDCAGLLSISEKLLVREVNKIRLKTFEKKQKETSIPVEQKEKNHSKTTKEDSSTVSRRLQTTKNPYEQFERELIRYVIRYGTLPIYKKYETQKVKEGNKVIEKKILVEEGLSVIEFIDFDLGRDNIKISNPLYREIFDEAKSRIHEKTFIPSRHFLTHHREEITTLASELMSDRYKLSKIHAKMIGEKDLMETELNEENLLKRLIPRATTELKNAYVLQKIREVKTEMKKANDEHLVTLIKQLKQLQEIKKILSKELGERIVLKY